MPLAPRLPLLATFALVIAGCRASAPPPAGDGAVRPAPVVSDVRPADTTATTPLVLHRVIPAPVHFELAGADSFLVTAATRFVVDAGTDSAGAWQVATHLAEILRPSTGFELPIVRRTSQDVANTVILRLAPDTLGPEGYSLAVTGDSVRISSSAAAGLFNGAQTFRQLLPAGIEAEQSVVRRGTWMVRALRIADRPRYAWRGAMLDVARHFFTVHEVKQFIDMLALYKLNVLHLHLTDDQGWRIDIRSRPQLAARGGVTQVGGGSGGFYTQADFAEIVRYAAARFITVVPEIDMPGHTNSALISHPELSCGRAPVDRPHWTAPAPYTGIRVGWSALCADREGTYALVEDVVRELAAITPGPYIHIGGDEVETLTDPQYVAFIERVQEIVARHGKRMIGWEEVSKARLRPTSLAQQWRSDSVVQAARQGARVILSPARRMYLDMQYTPATELGLAWAGRVEVRHAYEWDPATHIPGVGEGSIAGVEAPLWTETVKNLTAAQYLLMPRLPAIAEVAWTPQSAREWEHFRHRLAAHAPRWHILGINYYRSPQVPWPAY